MRRARGFSLLDLLAALGVSAVVLTAALASFVDVVRARRDYRSAVTTSSAGEAVALAVETDLAFAGGGVGELAWLQTGDGSVLELVGAFPGDVRSTPRVVWWLDAVPVDERCERLATDRCGVFELALSAPGSTSPVPGLSSCAEGQCLWEHLPLDPGHAVQLTSPSSLSGASTVSLRRDGIRLDDAGNLWVKVESEVPVERPRLGATLAELSVVTYRLEGETLVRERCEVALDGAVAKLRPPTCEPRRPVAHGIDELRWEVEAPHEDGRVLRWSGRFTQGASPDEEGFFGGARVADPPRRRR